MVELSKAQKQDAELLFVIDWVRKNAGPIKSVLFRASPAAKSHWSNEEQFLLLDDVVLSK